MTVTCCYRTQLTIPRLICSRLRFEFIVLVCVDASYMCQPPTCSSNGSHGRGHHAGTSGTDLVRSTQGKQGLFGCVVSSRLTIQLAKGAADIDLCAAGCRRYQFMSLLAPRNMPWNLHPETLLRNDVLGSFVFANPCSRAIAIGACIELCYNTSRCSVSGAPSLPYLEERCLGCPCR